MDNSRQLFQYILSGLSNGAIYALIGFGFAIIHNATGIINFAQGEFVMLGGMFTIFFLTFFNLPLVPAIILAILLSTIVGIAFERLAIRPLKNAKPLEHGYHNYRRQYPDPRHRHADLGKRYSCPARFFRQ